MGDRAIALGYLASARDSWAVAIGSSASAAGPHAIAIGHNSVSSGSGSIAIGSTSLSNDDYSVALGHEASATNDYAVAIGYKANASNEYSIAIGSNSKSSRWASFAAGYGAEARGVASVSIGGYNPVSSGSYSTAIGEGNKSQGYCSIAMGGKNITVSGEYSVGIALADATGIDLTQNNSMAIMGGNVGIGTTTASERLDVVGNINVSGSITGIIIETSSSRELKENIEYLTINEAIDIVDDLRPVKFNFKNEVIEDLHVGFIAEDVPDLVSTPERKGVSSIDILAALTKVIQSQQENLSRNQEIIDRLQKDILLLNSRVSD